MKDRAGELQGQLITARRPQGLIPLGSLALGWYDLHLVSLGSPDLAILEMSQLVQQLYLMLLVLAIPSG